jgi:hypothetical protein
MLEVENGGQRHAQHDSPDFSIFPLFVRNSGQRSFTGFGPDSGAATKWKAVKHETFQRSWRHRRLGLDTNTSLTPQPRKPLRGFGHQKDSLLALHSQTGENSLSQRKKVEIRILFGLEITSLCTSDVEVRRTMPNHLRTSHSCILIAPGQHILTRYTVHTWQAYRVYSKGKL